VDQAGGARVEALQVVSPGVRGFPDSLRMRIFVAPGGYLRLDHADRRFSLTLRPDGGEALDHRLRQLLRLPVEQAQQAAGIWSLLVGAGGGMREEPAGDRRALLRPGGERGVLPESLWVTLDRDSLPARIELAGVPRVTFRLSGWRFERSRDAARYKLAPPSGYEVVVWP
jgi:hypothetical protein